jgi:hypothetical protein
VEPTQKFNDDLLLHEVDRQLVKQRFPELFYVLDFPELRDLFSAYELEGNSAKSNRHHKGLWAIGLTAVGLLAATPLLSDQYAKAWALTIGILAAVLGIVGVLQESFGILSGASKERWLCARLMTERLRQFQFQVLTYRLQDILDPSVPQRARMETLVAKRNRWFAEFRLNYEGHLPARLQAILDDDAEEDFLLHHDVGCTVPPAAVGADLEQLFAAYRALRFEHQIQYANYKLLPTTRFFDSPVKQWRIFRNTALILIFLILLGHLAVAVSLSPPFGWASLARVLHLFMLPLVVAILVARALEEGLQPAREVERYTRYRASVVSLLGRFDRAILPEEKLRVMREMERTSYQEMRGFLKTHFESRYIL